MTKKASKINLEEIILQYKPLISYRVRRSLGFSNPDWEDVVAEIFINVIEKIKSGKFRGESSIGTFIYTITSRRIIDYIRLKKKRIKFAPEPAPPPDPHQSLEKKEDVELITEHIKKLKPIYCDILYSYYYGDLTQKEIAGIFGISTSKVNYLIHHAQKLLRKMISD
jgi:RNA polymerase sigma-70 factor (ECF subfamily)